MNFPRVNKALGNYLAITVIKLNLIYFIFLSYRIHLNCLIAEV
jgi:hypothetical protein